MPGDLLLGRLKGGLIVSCQAEQCEPLHGAMHMVAMALAAAEGGACAIRANSPADISAIAAVVPLPVIGLYKVDIPGFEVRITPMVEHARQVASAGADIIALDATRRPHPDGYTLIERLRLVKEATSCAVIADISTFEEGLAAAEAGADAIATTLSGYTEDSLAQSEPDLGLVERLAAAVRVPVIAEGRIATPEQAAKALELGAYAVVVGSAITRPQWITRRFVEKMSAYR